MLDAEDREFLAMWTLKAATAAIGVLAAAAVLGLAVRLFCYIVGV